MPTTRRWALPLAALVLAGCASDGSTAPATSTTAAVTTTTVRAPSPDDPLRVVLAGDSVMAGLVPPLQAAFEETGAAEGRFVLTPSILRDPAVRFTWERQLEEFEPEVVVVLMGTWEAMIVEGAAAGAAAPGSDEWVAGYRAELLEPWVDLLTAGGADVVWVGMPPVAEGEVAALLPALNAAFAGLADERDDLVYVPPGALTAPGGGPLGTADGAAGGAPLRQVDGLHLCPAGAARLAADVLDVLAERHDLPLGGAWTHEAAWSAAEISPGTPTYPPAACPAP